MSELINKKLSSMVLVEATFGHNFKHLCGGHNEFEPLGLEYIAAIIHQKGHGVQLLRQMSQNTDEVVRQILSYNPGIVCFAVLTYNYPEVLRIIKALKDSNGDIIVILGGYHASSDPENVLKSGYVDFVVIGEGEATISDLIDALNNGSNFHLVHGIGFLENGKVVMTSKRKRIKNLDSLPYPLRSIDILREAKIFGLMYPPPSTQVNVTTIACSRGCPYNCEFCCSNALWGKGVTYRSPQNIVQEIREVQERYSTNAFFFTDLTFNSSKGWVSDFCNEILKSGLMFNWYCMCTILGLDEELLQLMRRAGCRKIGFGIETLDDKLSNEIKSFKRPSIDKMNAIFDLCYENDIFTKAYLMIGFPDETYDSLSAYKHKIQEMRVDELKVAFYTPFPGTRAYEKYKHKLVYDDYNYFDSINHVVVKNVSLTEDQYKSIRAEIIEDFYRSEYYLSRMNKKIESTPYLTESYSEFIDFMKIKDMPKYKNKCGGKTIATKEIKPKPCLLKKAADV